MNTQVTITIQISEPGVFVFRHAPAAERPFADQQDDHAPQVTEVLPTGSSAISPGISVPIDSADLV